MYQDGDPELDDDLSFIKDGMPNEAERDGLFIDMYDCLSKIESDIRFGNTLIERTDEFSIGFEKIFDISIDQIDDIEAIINERQGDEYDMFVNLYNTFRDGILHIYDNFLGITFTYDNINRQPDLNELYSVYKVFYLGWFELLGKIVAYIINKNSDEYQLRATSTSLIDDVINDSYRFNLDTIPEILQIMDPGNSDYEFCFGEYSDDANSEEYMYENPKVAIEWNAWLHHVLHELNDGAGVANKENLLKNIIKYTEYIKSNNILR